MPSTSRAARRTVANRWAVIAFSATIALGACSADDDTSPADRGHDSARAAVQAHIDASREYDLEADCNLRTPERREEMAGFDGMEAEGYCAAVTASIESAADQATLDRSRSIYTDPAVTEIAREGGSWFEVVSADGSYSERVEAVEVDGRWWIGTVESEVDDHDHEEGDDHSEDGGEVEPTSDAQVEGGA